MQSLQSEHDPTARAFSLGKTCLLAPFEYLALPPGAPMGLALFGEIPTVPVLVGAGIVAGSGLFTIWRERQLQMTRAPRRRVSLPWAVKPFKGVQNRIA